MRRYALLSLAGRVFLRMKGVHCAPGVEVYGLPLVRRHPQAEIHLGEKVVLTSLSRVNLAGVNHPVILAAPFAQSRIVIGEHSGMSGGVIYAARSVRIGRHVTIGANTCIYDTDFHPLDFAKRRELSPDDAMTAPVVIEDDVWVGGHVIILKGVTIGQAAVIGAGSVVTQDIPPFTVWAGNPARFVKQLS